MQQRTYGEIEKGAQHAGMKGRRLYVRIRIASGRVTLCMSHVWLFVVVRQLNG